MADTRPCDPSTRSGYDVFARKTGAGIEIVHNGNEKAALAFAITAYSVRISWILLQTCLNWVILGYVMMIPARFRRSADALGIITNGVDAVGKIDWLISRRRLPSGSIATGNTANYRGVDVDDWHGLIEEASEIRLFKRRRGLLLPRPRPAHRWQRLAGKCSDQGDIPGVGTSLVVIDGDSREQICDNAAAMMPPSGAGSREVACSRAAKGEQHEVSWIGTQRERAAILVLVRTTERTNRIHAEGPPSSCYAFDRNRGQTLAPQQHRYGRHEQSGRARRRHLSPPEGQMRCPPPAPTVRTSTIGT